MLALSNSSQQRAVATDSFTFIEQLDELVEIISRSQNRERQFRAIEVENSWEICRARAVSATRALKASEIVSRALTLKPLKN